MSEDKKKVEKSMRRKERVPLGTPRQKLSLPEKTMKHFQDRNEVPRWVNDEPGRLEEFQRGGYRFVDISELTPEGVGQGGDVTQREGVDSRVSRAVGEAREGRAQRAYLMAQNKDDYDEDQQVKREAIQKKEEAMRQGVDSQGKPGVDGRYIPAHTPIKIEKVGQ